MLRTHQVHATIAALAFLMSACAGEDVVPDASSRVAVDPSPGCDAVSITPGRSEILLTSNGDERRYILYVPEGLEPGVPAPLVLDFPAYSPAELQEGFSGFTQPDAQGIIKAEEVGAIVATPEPIGGDGNLRAWNLTGEAIGFPDDQRFVIDLLTDVGARTCIDRQQVLAMGYAVGGVMAALVACNPEIDVAALVGVSGPYDPPECLRLKPIPVLAFHGTADPLIPYGGGIGPNVPQLNLGPVTIAGLAGIVPYLVGAQSSARAWAERNGCIAEPEGTLVVPTVTHETWIGCADGGAVELYTIEGAGHTWPDSHGMDGLTFLLGPTSHVINANQLIWDFFRTYVPET